MAEFTGYAFISIGANLPSDAGDPLDTIEYAFGELAGLSRQPLLKSSVYITSPVGSPPGTPAFHNAMAGIVPDEGETPLSLLHKLQAIEQAAGRVRSGIKNESRTLDLDLVTFKQEILDTDELTLPHPGAHQRKFVLEPLIEISGENNSLPGYEVSLRKQLDQLSDQQEIKKMNS